MALPDPPKLDYAGPESRAKFWEPDVGWPIFIMGCMGAAGLMIMLILIAFYILLT